MLNIASLSKAIGIMSLMKFFPSGNESRAALMELLGEMCESDDQVLWLARRMRNLYSEWPGAHELRACFCSKFSPRDGIDADSAVYLDGIPSERASEPLALPGARPLLIEGEVTQDAELNGEVLALAIAKSMPAPAKTRTIAEIEQMLYEQRSPGGEAKQDREADAKDKSNAS